MLQQPVPSTERPAMAAIAALLRPEAFPHAVSQLTLRETHLSWVVLTGTYAYKIKKPVKLDFVDASTLELRRHYCEEEVRLNRRLAPELYVDVVPITKVGGRPVIGGDGPAVEYAVRMQQFDAADELPALLASNVVDINQIEMLAESLASFHLKAAVALPERRPEGTEAMYETVLGNAIQLHAQLSGSAAGTNVRRLMDWTCETARLLNGVFHFRAGNGFIRECHGDLHAANIVSINGRLVPFDCIEFDPKLRWIDVMNDVAFLVMDLMSHERADLAFALLSRYLEITGDYEGVRVLPFYAVYRALVRAKVDALTAAQVPARADEFNDRLQRRIAAAQSWSAARHPRLILMHGASGSGKSWLSGRLVPVLGAVRMRSDLERKRLAGIDAAQSAAAGVGKGIYSPEFSHRTYSRLDDCAETCLRAGISVIIDAASLEDTDRRLFRALAARTSVPQVIVSCEADPITLARRVMERSGRGDASDATLAVLDSQLREMDSFDAAEAPFVVHVDTREPDVVQRVARAIRTLAPQ